MVRGIRETVRGADTRQEQYGAQGRLKPVRQQGVEIGCTRTPFALRSVMCEFEFTLAADLELLENSTRRANAAPTHFGESDGFEIRQRFRYDGGVRRGP